MKRFLMALVAVAGLAMAADSAEAGGYGYGGYGGYGYRVPHVTRHYVVPQYNGHYGRGYYVQPYAVPRPICRY